MSVETACLPKVLWLTLGKHFWEGETADPKVAPVVTTVFSYANSSPRPCKVPQPFCSLCRPPVQTVAVRIWWLFTMPQKSKSVALIGAKALSHFEIILLSFCNSELMASASQSQSCSDRIQMQGDESYRNANRAIDSPNKRRGR